MDKTQKKLIWASIIVVIVILLIKYAIHIVEINSTYIGELNVEPGTGNTVEQETQNNNVVENKQKEILEEINVTSELVINHLNREELYDKATKVLYGKIVDKKDAVFSKDIKYPFTTATFEVTKVIKGELPQLETTQIDPNKKREIDIKVPGGEVKLSEYMRATIGKNPEEIAKKGYDKLTEKEKDGKYIKVNYEYSNSFEKNEWYIIFVMGTENNESIVPTYTCMIPAEENMENITKESIMAMPEVIKK